VTADERRVFARELAAGLVSGQAKDKHLVQTARRLARNTFGSEDGAIVLAMVQELFNSGLSCRDAHDGAPTPLKEPHEVYFNEGTRAVALFLADLTEAR
jgi:hypothetical protein